LKSSDILGKKVLGNEAQILGKISEIEFNRNTWNISDICIDLEKNVMETMGFQKPRLGGIKAYIPVTEINAINDVVSLKKSATELKGIARRV
jgi:sporulation protein YlmC with PRC-barrel domain